MVDTMPSPLDWLRCHAQNVAPLLQDSPISFEPNIVTAPCPEAPSCVEQCLVSSPGFGVLDSGCGRSIIGEETLEEFAKMWKDSGIPEPDRLPETNHFRYGNGEQETARSAVKMPVVLGTRSGTIRAAVVRGRAPFLISRQALQTLKATINFATSELTLFDGAETIPLTTNSAGQFVVNVIGSSSMEVPDFEVMMNQVNNELPSPPEEPMEACSPAAISPPSDVTQELLPGPDLTNLQVWTRQDSFVSHVPYLGRQGPYWSSVRHRRVYDDETNVLLFDEPILPQHGKSKYHHSIPKHVMHVRTEFFFSPQEKAQSSDSIPVHYVRQLESQVRRTLTEDASTVRPRSKLLVAEVFSPPRFSPVVESLGHRAKSFDLKNGYDFRDAQVRSQVRQELQEDRPELLVLSPPCTDEGGWFNLNSCTMSPTEYLRRKYQSRLYIKFCCQLFEDQVNAGGRAVLEHPKGSRLWTYPEVQRLCQRCQTVDCHMCRFGLRLPGEDKLIRKATQLLISHEDMKPSLNRTCPGKNHPRHVCHQVIAGSASGVGKISTFAGQYTPAFVHAVLRTVPEFRRIEAASLVECSHWPQKYHSEVCAVKADLESPASDEELMRVIDKLHKNLGHPPTQDMIRILKHAQASQRSIDLARKHECDFCKAQVRPHVPLPAKSGRPMGFNEVIGMDVKYLPGWRPNQKVKALNIVCQGSSYQMMLPFHEQETSQVLKNLFATNWVRVFGPPKEIILDPAQTNLGDVLQSFLEQHGTHVKQIAADAHWQLGRTENHGGWFARILGRVISQYTPEDQKAWDECVIHAHVKNQMIQSYGYTPHQHVFGKNPHVPGDLLDEPLNVVPATAGLTDLAVAKTQAIRNAARKAVLELQDSYALRRALAARPRVPVTFESGDLVAYWRGQKLQNGQVVQGGRWHGTAVVIGSVGRNFVVAHRKQIFRVAPEQLRPATSEERATVETPQTELLGIKDMIEGGTFRGRNYIDLVPGHYPTEADVNVPVEDEPIDKSPASFPVVPPSSQEAEVTTTHVPGNGSDGNPSNPDINMSSP